MQGLIVAAGNPWGLASVRDLKQPGLRYIARQPGSGTRLLGDALFEQEGIDPAAIECLAHVEESHLAVAATVACGAADAGLGIAAAAQAFGLGFVPLAEERYFFVCLKPSLDDPAVQSLLALLGSAAWAAHLADLNGYQSDAAGEVLRLTEALPWWNEVVGTPRRKPVASP
jgi:putative molybdopterin biosynthesis protein